MQGVITLGETGHFVSAALPVSASVDAGVIDVVESPVIAVTVVDAPIPQAAPLAPFVAPEAITIDPPLVQAPQP